MKRTVTIAAVLLVGQLAFAQTFNPTVVVTNSYEGTLEANKKDLPVLVPDSLAKFDLNFDYSIFDNPYKGSYEFSPYQMNMKPEAAPSPARFFTLSAGVGLPLHPELDLAVSPRLDGRFQIGVYDQLRGYLGPYRDYYTALGGNSPVLPLLTERNFSGHDFSNNLVVAGRYDGDETLVSFDLGYRMIAASDSAERHSFNALTANTRIRSRVDPVDPLSYDVALGVLYGSDDLNWPNNYFTQSQFGTTELDVNFDADVLYALSPNIRVGAVAGMDLVSLGKTVQGYAAHMYVVPQLVWTNGPGLFKAGVKFSSVMHEDRTDISLQELYGHKPGYLFPDISFSYRLLDDHLTLFTDVTGGNHLNSLSEILERNHFYNTSRTKTIGDTFDTTVEMLNISAGVKGSASAYFQYDFRAGYARTQNGLIDHAFLSFANNGFDIFGTYSYADYDQKYTELYLVWMSKSLDVSLGGRYQDTKLRGEEPVFGIVPARYQASGSLQYNYKRRIFFGVTADYASDREGYATITRLQVPMVLNVPGYVDLGCFGRFNLNDRLGAWAKVGNILNQNIQKTLFHSEAGLYFTAGICLNL